MDSEQRVQSSGRNILLFMEKMVSMICCCCDPAMATAIASATFVPALS